MFKDNDTGILYLSKTDVETVCQKIDSVAIITDVFRMHATKQTVLPDEAYLSWNNAKGEQVRSLNMPGYVGGTLRVAGTKVINSNIRNPERGLPRASGLTLIYDDLSVRVACIMEGAYISSLRTASVTALAADVLQGPTISTVAIIGAGELALAHIKLLMHKIPHMHNILLFDLNYKQCEALHSHVAELLQQYRVTLSIVSTAEEAIREAQLIVPVTTTTVGYIHFDWLQPGSVLVNVSLDDPLPEVVLKADNIIVDDWTLVKNDSRRLLGRMYRQGQIIGPDEVADGHLKQRRIDTHLGEVVIGTKVGRGRKDDILLVNPFGLAIEDVALGAHVYEKALQLGIGTWLQC